MHTLITVFIVSLLATPFTARALSYVGYPQTYPYYDSWSYGNSMMNWCGSYYGSCAIGTQHTFAPYTYVNTYPYTSVAASASAYPQQNYGYSYPQYQTYMQPNYYQPSTYGNYGYSNSPSYTPYYMSGGEYCYSGYGCYPFYVEDPHQWVYDHWTGTWY